MDRRPLKTRGKKWVEILTHLLLKTNIKPNHVSIFGIGCAFLAGVSFYFSAGHSFLGWYLVAAVFIQLRLLCNMMDGMLAVEGNQHSVVGDMFNEIPDRYEDIFIFVGAGFACGHVSLGWAAATFALLTAYIRSFGASLGTPQFYGGPMAKPHRMFALTVACFLEVFVSHGSGQMITLALAVIVVGCLITAIRRRWMIVGALKENVK